MFRKGSRISREKKTVRTLIEIYCRAKHGNRGDLCPECHELAEYADLRLSRCRYGENKPTCGNCPIHCYKPAMKNQIKEVMRYSGPRITYIHPVMALDHVVAGLKRVEK